MAESGERRLSPSEVEAVLRRAAELHARGSGDEAGSVSVKVLVQVAQAAGIPEREVHRALRELDGEHPIEGGTLARKLYGPARVKKVAQIPVEEEESRERLEFLLRVHQGLKMRSRTAEGSVWDGGDAVGAVRRTLNFSGGRALLDARSIEMRVIEAGQGVSESSLVADLSNRREEHLSMAGLLAATISIPLAIAGVYDPLYLLAIPPAAIAPLFGFRAAYHRVRSQISGELDAMLGSMQQKNVERGGERERASGPLKDPGPIPKFEPRRRR